MSNAVYDTMVVVGNKGEVYSITYDFDVEGLHLVRAICNGQELERGTWAWSVAKDLLAMQLVSYNDLWGDH